ncbi:MAG: PP2C family protein-serine/threonine phosphatase [Terriglobia bacterium]
MKTTLSQQKVTTLEARVQYLEELNSWLLNSCFDIVASFAHAQSTGSGAQDPTTILHSTWPHIKRLMPFRYMGFSVINEVDSSFDLTVFQPESARTQLQKEVDAQIGEGNFGWALNQNCPVIVPAKQMEGTLVLHALGTRSSVLGMFVGVLAGEELDVSEESKGLLSLLLFNTAYALESTALYRRISNQNRDLEKLVESRTHELQAANTRMRKDLESAAKIQLSLLPKSAPIIEGVRFAWQFKPCDELAGDILNIVRLDERHMGLYVLDVSNHGVPAALLAVTLSRLLSPLSIQSSLLKQPCEGLPGYRIVSPVEVAIQLNQLFPMDPATGQYFTLLYGVLDLETNQFCYVQAGHPGPIHLKAETKTASILEGQGLPIGFAPKPTYQLYTIQLNRGDRLYLYSDGLPEMSEAGGEHWGEKRMMGTLEQTTDRSLQESLCDLISEAQRWQGKALTTDDLSLLAVEVETG